MCRIPELLVPAGGMEQLKAAVACGADAVYVGGVSFSARAHAANFSDEELQEAIEYAHTYGVKIHVALNTLLADRELPEALAFALQVYKYGADAVIVQDTGLFSLIHHCIPGLALHLSTQGTVTDSYGVRSASERGAERVVLARELSLHEITEICRNKGNTEIEIFVHGAICIGLSGQCHMSGLIGGRSGNRGDCAQPCRMKYSLEKKGEGPVSEGYQLSPKDMCLLPHLEEITRAGVDSIKVEGRMKSPEYVAAVTGIYRKHLDWIRDGVPEKALESLNEDIRVLRQMYSRGSFTDAYIKGSADVQMMSGRSPKHQGLPIGHLMAFYPKTGHAGVRLSGELSMGDGVEVRGKRGSADNVVTYMKDARGQMVKTAESGSRVEIGDLRRKGGIPEKGAEVYKLTDRALSLEMKRLGNILPQRIPVRLHMEAAAGKPLTVVGEVQEGGKTFLSKCSSQEILEPARSAEADRNKLAGKLSRTGGTPYFCIETSMETEGNPFVRISRLNELRRQVLEDLTAQRLSAFRPSEAEAGEAAAACHAGRKNDRRKEGNSSDPELLFQLYFYDISGIARKIRDLLNSVKQGILPAERLIWCLPLSFLKNPEQVDGILTEIRECGCRFDIVLPVELRRTGWGENRLIGALQTIRSYRNFRAAIASDAGQISFLKEAEIPFELDQQMNVLNAEASSFWLGQGALSVCLTEEPEALSSFAFDESDAEHCCVQLYGRIPVMYLEHCPVGAQGTEVWDHDKSAGGQPCCSAEKKYYYCRKGGWKLRDRTGAVFPVVADSACCRAVVYSHKKIDRSTEINALIEKGVRIFRISICDESVEEIVERIRKLL